MQNKIEIKRAGWEPAKIGVREEEEDGEKRWTRGGAYN
jgi:hypothetical protein